jgi:hypothetical protein
MKEIGGIVAIGTFNPIIGIDRVVNDRIVSM